MDDVKRNQYDIRDPREEYRGPPFPAQEQEKPGLESEMTPTPDHGEETYEGLGRMKGRKALITGGDSGLGRAAAIAYMREGARVVINYLPEEEADARSLFALAEAEGGDITGVAGDLREAAVCERLVGEAADRLGGLDAVVLNAGYQIAQDTIADITTEQFDRTLKTNCYALFWLSKAALPLMPPGGTIINVTSTQGFDAYCFTASGMVAAPSGHRRCNNRPGITTISDTVAHLTPGPRRADHGAAFARPAPRLSLAPAPVEGLARRAAAPPAGTPLVAGPVTRHRRLG